MKRILGCALGLFALSLAALPAQGDDTATRKTGTLWKSEVDGLIRSLRDAARAHDLPALGGDSVLATAKILTAMGHCHRRYHESDGPVVRPSMQFLIRHRGADGSFGDAATTAWVVDALEVIDPDGYRDEVAVARRWLAEQDAAAAPFAARVAQVLDRVRADVFPEHLGADAAARARQQIAADTAPERDAAADTLVELVCCQVANRALDRMQEAPQEAAKAWSPEQQKAFAWLSMQQQDGVFAVRGHQDAGLTAFGLWALQTKPRALRTADEQKTIESGLRWLLAQQRDDGTFSEHTANYVTCVAVGALSRWDDPAVAPALAKAQRAILGFQNVESAGYQRSDRDYGSIGYGGAQRGDLSNMNFALQALRDTGLPADHDAFQKALVFLQRTQNLKSVNDFSGKVPDPDREGVILDATSGDDGGAVYYPGNSAAGYIVQPDGKTVPRSYGTMTYALLKAYLLSGLPAGDPRVQAAVRWIQDNWTLAVNPGSDPEFGEKARYQGLYYYYLMLAQALDLVGVDTVTVRGDDGSVQKVDWRRALREKLAAEQQADGSWVNDANGRWMESVPLLCTAYAMVALEHCQ